MNCEELARLFIQQGAVLIALGKFSTLRQTFRNFYITGQLHNPGHEAEVASTLRQALQEALLHASKQGRNR